MILRASYLNSSGYHLIGIIDSGNQLTEHVTNITVKKCTLGSVQKTVRDPICLCNGRCPSKARSGVRREDLAKFATIAEGKRSYHLERGLMRINR
jgi:hypothetical protein